MIKANKNSDKNIYIQSVRLNGRDYTKCYLDYKDIMAGGILELEMGNTPNFSWGYKLGILSNAFPQKHTKGRAQIPYLYYSVKQ